MSIFDMLFRDYMADTKAYRDEAHKWFRRGNVRRGRECLHTAIWLVVKAKDLREEAGR